MEMEALVAGGSEGDVILTLGAGSVSQAGALLMEGLYEGDDWLVEMGLVGRTEMGE